MSSSYELAILYHPDLEIDLEKAAEKVNKIVTDNGGKIVSEDNWGKRKLAYKIKGHDHAVYVFYAAEIPAQSVRKVESTLNITDEVIRFLVTKPDVKAIAQAEAYKAKQKAKKENETETQEVKED